MFKLISAFLLLLLSGCDDSSYKELPVTKIPIVKPVKVEKKKIVKEIKPTVAKLVAIGDIMMHSPQLNTSYIDKTTKKYNFTSFFETISPFLQGDFVIGNLETVLAGEEEKFTGYPMFNSPDELLDALKVSGFNILGNANNHSMDRRANGVLRTLGKIEEYGFVSVGTANSAEYAKRNIIVEKNDIRLGMLAYTYGTNGIPLPKDQPYLVAHIDEKEIIADIKRLKEQKVDFLAVMLHFGNEYQRDPNDQQIKLARSLVASGADLIIGSHPHVVQPYENVEVTEQDGSKRNALILYSMGNFISNQKDKWTDYGLIFSMDLEKKENKTVFKNVKFEPTWVHIKKENGQRRYRVLPVSEIVEGTDIGKTLTQKEIQSVTKDGKILTQDIHKLSQSVVSLVATQPATQ